MSYLHFRLVSLVTLMCLHTATKAEENLRLSGFVSVGASFVNANNLLSNTDDKHEIFNAGLRASYQISNNISVNGQIAYRRFADNANDESIKLDYATVDWTTNSLGFGEQQISLGRVKVPTGLYNASRDVPQTRPSIFLSPTVYSYNLSNLSLNIDGVKLRTSHAAFDGLIAAELIHGTKQIDSDFDEVIFVAPSFGNQSRGDWKSNNSTVVDIKYYGLNTLCSYSYSAIDLEFNPGNGQRALFGPNIPVSLVAGNFDFDTHQLSYQRQINQFEFTYEFIYRKVDINGVVNGFPVPSPRLTGNYAQLKYQALNSVSFLVRYDVLNSLNKTPQSNIPGIVSPPSWASSAKTSTIGVDWQFSSNWNLSSEVHFVSGSGWLPPFSGSLPQALEKHHWTLFATELSYRF